VPYSKSTTTRACYRSGGRAGYYQSCSQPDAGTSGQAEINLRLEDPQDRRIKQLSLTTRGIGQWRNAFGSDRLAGQSGFQSSADQKQQIAAAVKILIEKNQPARSTTRIGAIVNISFQGV